MQKLKLVRKVIKKEVGKEIIAHLMKRKKVTKTTMMNKNWVFDRKEIQCHLARNHHQQIAAVVPGQFDLGQR